MTVRHVYIVNGFYTLKPPKNFLKASRLRRPMEKRATVIGSGTGAAFVAYEKLSMIGSVADQREIVEKGMSLSERMPINE